uniref:Flavin-containing monooxygenase n=1 Tax=Panagrellus redivivus TaxID=6233 RepID=A0A7E4UXP2_PANRE
MPDKVAIIGAGASGLTAARQAIAYGFEPVIFEKLSDLGGIWRYSENPNVRSVSWSTTNTSSKELSAFSDFAPSEAYSKFMHHTEVLNYLEAYAAHFKLREHIKFDTEVTLVARADDWEQTGDWVITYNDKCNACIMKFKHSNKSFIMSTALVTL